VGLIQRAIEAVGIATISITLSLRVTRKINPSRALCPDLPLGHPFGFPGDAAGQKAILRLLLHHLQSIQTPGTILRVDPAHPDQPAMCTSLPEKHQR